MRTILAVLWRKGYRKARVAVGKQEMIAEVHRGDGGSSGGGQKRVDWRWKLEGQLAGLAGG